MAEQLLNYEEFSSPFEMKKNTIFLAHGLLGSKRNWISSAKIISERLNKNVVVIDLRNHGSSFWSDTHDYQSLGQDLIRLADNFKNNIDLVGHSMGGKAVMSASLLYPERFSKLVVVDISPVTYSNSDFEEYIVVLKKLDLSRINSRRQADHMLKGSISDSKIRSFLLQNIFRKKNGTFNWRVNLNSIKKNIRQILSFPEYQSQFLGRTLFLKGQKSKYISENSIIKINKLFPNNQIKEIRNSGHWPHIDQKNLFLDKLFSFLS